jgi:uncharacterized protein (UPF0210 family)
MTEQAKNDAPVYDDRGNVRPTDARYAGRNREQLSNQELAAIREQEIADATERLRQDQEKLQAENDQRLADSIASVSPATSTASTTDDAELKGQALEDALKERGLPSTGTADEKRARVAEHDQAGA